MNVVVPMGGIGARFSKSGYRFPKPLINILGNYSSILTFILTFVFFSYYLFFFFKITFIWIFNWIKSNWFCFCFWILLVFL